MELVDRFRGFDSLREWELRLLGLVLPRRMGSRLLKDLLVLWVRECSENLRSRSVLSDPTGELASVDVGLDARSATFASAIFRGSTGCDLRSSPWSIVPAVLVLDEKTETTVAEA